MRKVLITGGSVFVSKYIAEYYVSQGDDVYVINRNNHKQVNGVKLIECDRHNLGDRLKNIYFDIVLDVTGYNLLDVKSLTTALNEYGCYIFISSSAVYPETNTQPFIESQEVGVNKIWGEYGINKFKAEKYLLANVKNLYILRPPYLYGKMQNLYREAFVFDCALLDRSFYLPHDGSMKLQFFNVRDLCKVIDYLSVNHPTDKIYNVGNTESVSIMEWVKACYQVTGKKANFCMAKKFENQRDFFPFYEYEYKLNVDKQNSFFTNTVPLIEGLKEEFNWYMQHMDEVKKKNYIEYIDRFLK